MANWQACMFPQTSSPPLHRDSKLTNITTDNPFSKRESYANSTILTYKILTILTWLLSVIVSVYYTLNAPHDGHHIRRRIWDQNTLYPTAFTMNSIIADIYWYVASANKSFSNANRLGSGLYSSFSRLDTSATSSRATPTLFKLPPASAATSS